ncbi:hypothetical protein K388_07383 [Streptomyces sp. KhCrAH-43]|uniref:hypothetical protein n=1 Tax=unclassified Streptomyces TaxID=2593676 RepID=UPI00036EEEE1|nr:MULTISPECIES: hypothetical protein [unclassified Streptomyces]MYS36353.1 hypothetical protein [Streptomyces sp. SID4920]MYX64008.1 hypothetical protein [Streptomyces sp. SID8373]RAJ44298.1 hypothetical protein K388_07383 [Streptomyces sp. KhCrAH-43]
MTDTKKRYRYGKPDDDGRTPVYVGGATEPAGRVKKFGRDSHTWWAAYPSDGSTGTAHTLKREAAEQLVRKADGRASMAAETERRRARRTQAPSGWRFASWTEIEREGYRQVRPVHRAPHVCGHEGERYPDTFAAQPVTLTRVTTLHNGCVVASGTEPGDRPPYVLLMDPEHVALGALVREHEPRYVAQGECMGCAQEGPLYQAGTRLGCPACTAADTGVSPADLPAAVDDDGTVWWSVGDTVRRRGEIPDKDTEPETGRVTEIETCIAERSRRIAVDFGDRWPVRWQPAGLAPVS